MFQKYLQQKARKQREERRIGEALHQAVAEEMKNGIRHEGLWVKAYSEFGGDENAAKARYIELRVISLTDEIVQEEETKEERKNAEEEAKEILIDEQWSIVSWYEERGVSELSYLKRVRYLWWPICFLACATFAFTSIGIGIGIGIEEWDGEIITATIFVIFIGFMSLGRMFYLGYEIAELKETLEGDKEDYLKAKETLVELGED
jgi:hypothetical protein